MTRCQPLLRQRLVGTGPRPQGRPRALVRAVERGQSTHLLGICDFDLHGIRNILRPHLENVAAFLYGTSGNTEVLSLYGKQMFDCPGVTVTFEHVALTPEMALTLVDSAARPTADRRLSRLGGRHLES